MPVPTLRRRAARLVAASVAFAAAVVTTAVSAVALVPTTPDSAMWGVDGRVRAIVETPTAIYLGGDFDNLVGPSGQTVARTNFAALDPATGAPLSLAPVVNKTVYDIAVSPDGSAVYISGAFTKVGGVTRGRVAAFSTSTGALLPYDAKADANVEALVVTSSTVYLGGAFLNVGSPAVARTKVAATTLAGAPTAFSATLDDLVHDMALTPDGSQLVVGGLFATVNGSTNGRKLVLLNPATGAPTYLVDRVGYEVFGLGVSGSQIFAAAGGAGGHAYAINLATRKQQWQALTNGDVHSMTLQNGVLYVGGHFTEYSGVAASHVAAVSPTNGARIPWTITVNSNLGVFTTSSFNGHLSVGGDFTKINSRARSHYARFSEVLDTQAPTAPGTPAGTSTGATTATVTWPASTDNTVANVVYSVYRDGGSTPVGQVTSASTGTVSFADSGMSPGTTHTWRVSASDGVNTSALSATSNAVTLDDPGYPVLTGLALQDTNTNGRVDQVVATFSAPVTCTAPCLVPWTVSNVPSGGSLKSVAVSGATATLSLKEGTGAMDTSVGTMTVALAASATGVVDGQGRQARFAATAPADQAGPVPTDITSTNGAVDNVMEPGDTFTVTFSEPIDPASVHQANVKEFDQNGAGNDQLIIVGLTDGPMDLGSNDYVTAPGGTIVFADSTLTMLNNNTKIRSTIVGLCTGTSCGATGSPVESVVTFRPEPVLTDLAGNGAVGSRTEAEGPY